MKNIYAFESKIEFETYEERIERFTQKLSDYRKVLEDNYQLLDPPKAVIWTSGELAMETFSTKPIPAYTNKDLITITPDLACWKRLFLSQLEGKELPEIHHFYQNLSENHILQILGHELTHHLDLFLDDFDDEGTAGIWFEEGMVEYLSRHFLLTQEEFKKITEIETALVAIFKNEHGTHSLEHFGEQTYAGSISSIFYEYWRSFLTVTSLVEQHNNDPLLVFKSYHEWDSQGRTVSLTKWFKLE